MLRSAEEVARQRLHDQFDGLRSLITNPDVWQQEVILIALERLRTDVMLELGEPPERLTITPETRWG